MISIERKQSIKKQVVSLLGKTLEEIINEQGITLYTADLSDLLKDTNGGEISGLIRYLNGNYAIFINESDIDTRKRFTLAHELGHFFLHKKILEQEKFILDLKPSVLCRISGNNEETIEQEANFFAAELLMPEDIIRKARSLEKDIPKLAEKFFVSVLALTYRLINLGLIEE